jgi:hypothetical protein
MRKFAAPRLAAILTLCALYCINLARPAALRAQRPADSSADSSSSRAWGLDLTIHNSGVGIGNVPRVNGLRLNYRDRGSVRVNGVNATLWMPVGEARGEINGAALGLPVTGALAIRGLALGVAGVGADDVIAGLGLAPIGLGSGNELRGIMIAGIGGGTGGDMTGVGLAGIGFGSGNDMKGVMIGGVGVGSGDDATGIMLGGVGAGAGGSLRGVGVGGIGVGAGEELRGIVLGGVGAGAGNSLEGIGIAGLGVGAGDDVTGLVVAGVGVGAGGRLKGVAVSGIAAGAGELLEGLAIAGVAAGAPRVVGAVISPVAGARDARGVVLAPAYFKITDGGSFTGFSASAFNHIKGSQRGLVIGIFNYARSLHGVQIGVLNYAGNNRKSLRLLPLFNAHLH